MNIKCLLCALPSIRFLEEYERIIGHTYNIRRRVRMCDSGSATATGKRMRWGDTGVRENLRRSWNLTWDLRKAGVLVITWRQHVSPVLVAHMGQGTLVDGRFGTYILAVMPGRGEKVGRDQQGGHMKASSVSQPVRSGSFLCT